MNLLELQRRMAEDVRRPLTPDFKRRTVTETGRPSVEIDADYIKPSATLSSFERLEIYNRQYWFRMIDAVSEDYPALNAVLGPERFDALIRAYVRENPSTSFTMRNLGRDLPAWLDQHAEFTGKRHALAVDVACLEWAYIEAFDSADLPPMNSSDVTRVHPTTVLALQPHLQLVRLRYPVDQLVLAIHRNAPEADIVSSAAMVPERHARAPVPKMRRSATYLAVHRYDDCVYYRRLAPEEYWLLSVIRKGGSVEAAIDVALAASKRRPYQLAASIRDCFAHACELGWIVPPKARSEGPT